jgi:hypothetical protein
MDTLTKCSLCKENDLADHPYFDREIELHVCDSCRDNLIKAEVALKEAGISNYKK